MKTVRFVPLSIGIILMGVTCILPTACKKNVDNVSTNQTEIGVSAAKGPHTSVFSSDVATAWMKMQLRIMSSTTMPNVAFCRPYAYSAVAMYEAVVPGMPSYKSLVGLLNGLPAMPQLNGNLLYDWPSSANAALASILKKMYPTTSAANQAAIDSLENALSAIYSAQSDAATITRSIAFGRGVAQTVFDWSETDGYLHASDPYTAPIGSGLWIPTPPAFAPASTPYWGNLRPMVASSGDNTQPAAPMPYSEVPGSDFYNMVKKVYDASQTLTQAQKDMALYWRDIPGVSTPGHYLSILEQVLEIQKPNLENTAVAYALCAITVNDAAVSCWKTKYANNLVRPVTYIRNVLGYTTWSSFLGTPAHPEYSSAHAVLSCANADILTSIFGANYSFTDHTYDYFGFPSRSFSSFQAIGEDAANSRLYAGIHYQNSIDIGITQGRKVAANVLSALQLRKI